MTTRHGMNLATGAIRRLASDYTEAVVLCLVPWQRTCRRGWSLTTQFKVLPTLCPRRVSKSDEELVETGKR